MDPEKFIKIAVQNTHIHLDYEELKQLRYTVYKRWEAHNN